MFKKRRKRAAARTTTATVSSGNSGTSGTSDTLGGETLLEAPTLAGGPSASSSPLSSSIVGLVAPPSTGASATDAVAAAVSVMGSSRRRKGGKGGKSSRRGIAVGGERTVRLSPAVAMAGKLDGTGTIGRPSYSAQHLAELAAETKVRVVVDDECDADDDGDDKDAVEGDESGIQSQAAVKRARDARRQARMVADQEETDQIGVAEGDFIPLLGEGDEAKAKSSKAAARSGARLVAEDMATDADELAFLDGEHYADSFAFGAPGKNAARAKPAKATQLDLDPDAEAAIVAKGTSRAADAAAIRAAVPLERTELYLAMPERYAPPSISDVLASIAARAAGTQDAADAAADAAAQSRAALESAQTTLADRLAAIKELSSRLAFVQQLGEFVVELGDCLVAQLPLVDKAEAAYWTALTRPVFLAPDTVITAEARTARLQALATTSLPADPWLSDDDAAEASADASFPPPPSDAAPFANVTPEFGSAEAVVGVFANWRREHAGAYRDAFGSLALRTALAPFVRASLLGWEPHRGASLEDALPWLEPVFEFGTTGSLPDDEALLADLLAAHLVPHLTKMVRTTWRWALLSGKFNQALQDALALVTEFFGGSEAAAPTATLEPLISALKSAMLLMVQPSATPLPPLARAPGMYATPGMAAVFAHYFQLALKALRLISSWDGFVPWREGPLTRASLARTLFGSYIHTRLLPALEGVRASAPGTAAERALEMILVLPPGWQPGVVGSPVSAADWAPVRAFAADASWPVGEPGVVRLRATLGMG
ncbi:uncharacterized protein AMSG_06813 [Thecamonas trahens ATCC 50062]|uniref:GCF C-terminal domain-containing protein n=1 Tax=Thecamonas trahens ATCC 50062 TaxID=461836 RepID=A0A0L0DDN2_THETB|nr:hypothetical protein AMSG_06813 [Thecamonas trahens ATCC 50062]KNC50330.1 hypothetical protein AMSG_06813 [Thecamonas trahens ATCC 50062]|eukprot:XP_013756876.1 hypothetical protein AMSG_06813 [Thecamonas trahens ATCC 50062]